VKKRPRLTRARLRALLRYNKKTGEFRWRKRNAIGAPLGHSDSRQPDCRYIRIDGRLYREHQLAWFYVTGRWCKPTIDHRDGNVNNNRWKNLRRATYSQNNANRRRPRHNRSGYKGVWRCRDSRKWRAKISMNGRVINLGRFATPKEAHEVYLKAARKLFGKFARAE
jgi:HNH endonuclease/AP2 domain